MGSFLWAMLYSEYMEKVLTLYKKLGETPLECLNRFRLASPEYNDIPMTYAGRLDPMAEGLLIVLVGDEAKNRDFYTDLSKEYEFEVLFGFQTDTYDTLGLVGEYFENSVSEELVKKSLGEFVGNHTQKYPPYSSKTVLGTPLFTWAREGKLGEIEIPTREISIFSLSCVESKSASKEYLLSTLKERIKSVTGDFRQEEILNHWESVLVKSPNEYKLFKLHISCGSGTYVRSLVHELGQKFGCGAVAWSIKRVRVADYRI